MFTATIEFSSLRDFQEQIGFWGGATAVYQGLSDKDVEYLDACIEEYNFTSFTQINDFVWFDVLDLLEEREEE